jgi:hypothetical protein
LLDGDDLRSRRQRDLHSQAPFRALTFALLVAATSEQLNRGYVCPAGAGPAWRAACEYGFDMSLVEEALRMSEEQRLADHQRALDRILRFTSRDDASPE